MMTLNDRQPIIVADTGPLIRLAAAGLLDSIRGLNRRFVLVDRVEKEAIGDLSKPFAQEIKNWIDKMGDAIERVETLTGTAITALENMERTPTQDALLKKSMRDSGELALREFAGHWHPTETSSAIVVYEDHRVAVMFLEAEFTVTLITTRSFANLLVSWGVNVDARTALEGVAGKFTMYPARSAEYREDEPYDMRMLPQDDEPK
jgi:hypothetical protein